MYTANRLVNENGGQENTSNPPATRHRPAASVVGNFHETAESMSRIMHRHGHSAIMGALQHARSELQSGQQVKSINLQMAQEQMATLTGRELAETMHGDSASSRMISKLASAAGPPSTFTNLPSNGRLFNARNIPSCNVKHRQTNNRLVPMSSLAGTRNVLFPEGVNQRTPAPPSASRKSGPRSGATRAGTSCFFADENLHPNLHEHQQMTVALEQSMKTMRSQRKIDEYKAAQEEADFCAAIAKSKETAAEEDEIAAALVAMPNGTPAAELVDGRKRPAEVTELKKPQKSMRPNKQEVDVQLAHAIDCAIESFGEAPEKANLPKCTDDVDTSFFTDETKAPIHMTAADNDSDVNMNLLVDDHVARAFQRSFDESMAMFDGEVVDVDAATAATSRVRMISDQPGKVRMLVGAYINSSRQRGKDIDSPAVNRMLDNYR